MAQFGEGEGPIFLDDTSCTGFETSLQLCPHGGVGNHNCVHREDSGVICTSGNSDVKCVSHSLPTLIRSS